MGPKRKREVLPLDPLSADADGNELYRGVRINAEEESGKMSYKQRGCVAQTV